MTGYRDGESLSDHMHLHHSTQKTGKSRSQHVPQEFRGASLCRRVLFQAQSDLRRQPMYLTAIRVSVGARLSIDRGVKASIVERVEGLLQFRPSGALLTSLTQLGAGLTQVS